MNHSSHSLTLSTCIEGFLNFKMAEGLSQNSVNCYAYILRKWLDHQGDCSISSITTQDLTAYLAWLRTEYQPKRFNKLTHPLSAKSIRNIWVAFKSFFSWVNQELGIANPAKELIGPRFQKATVQTFTRDEIEAMLKACQYSREANTAIRSTFKMRRPTSNRDQATILILIDTGLRVSELCALTIGDIDLKTGKVSIKHGTLGKAKGGKGRFVYLGKVARKVLWRYLANREDRDQANAPLILSQDERPFTKDSLRILLSRIGKRAGIQKTYPHKFRHTFAITYLRSGGDVFTLQALLGHSSLDMVRHYAQIAEIDVEQAHNKASPVDNWRL